MDARQSVNAGARLDRLPISRLHWRILGLITAGSTLDAFDIYLAGGVVAAMLKEGFATTQQSAVFISTTFFGMLIGAGFAGYLGDRMGRRYSYQFNLALFGVASLAACFAPNITVLTALRFIMGIGMGAELVVAAGTLCEFVPPAYRGRWISMLGIVTNAGLLLASTIGFVVIPNLGWRYMFAIVGVGALIVWVLRKKMPESPRWLEAVGRLDEAEATLRAFEEEVAQGRELPPPAVVRRRPVVEAPFSTMFRSGMVGRTITAALTVMAVNVSVYGFVAWLPTFMLKQGMTIVQSLGFTMLMSFGSVAGALVGMAVGDRILTPEIATRDVCRYRRAWAPLSGIARSDRSHDHRLCAGDVDLHARYARALRLCARIIPDRISTARDWCGRRLRPRCLNHYAVSDGLPV